MNDRTWGSPSSTRFHRRHLRKVRLIRTFLGRVSVSTLSGLHAPYGAFLCNLTHWRASQVFPVSEANFLSTAAINQNWQLCRILGGTALVATGGDGHGVTMLMVETVGISGSGGIEVLIGGGKCEINRRQRYDHPWVIVLVLVTKIAYIACAPLLLPLAWLNLL